jgi:predicted aspartyl protease
MMRGVVNARHEAVVRLRVRGPGGVESDVDTIVDSGFTSSLTLPATMLTALWPSLDSRAVSRSWRTGRCVRLTSLPRKWTGTALDGRC